MLVMVVIVIVRMIVLVMVAEGDNSVNNSGRGRARDRGDRGKFGQRFGAMVIVMVMMNYGDNWWRLRW